MIVYCKSLDERLNDVIVECDRYTLNALRKHPSQYEPLDLAMLNKNGVPVQGLFIKNKGLDNKFTWREIKNSSFTFKYCQCYKFRIISKKTLKKIMFAELL